LDAIEFAETTLQLHGAGARDYEKQRGIARYNISDSYADAITVFRIVCGCTNNDVRLSTIKDHLTSPDRECVVVGATQVQEVIERITHQLNVLRLLDPR